MEAEFQDGMERPISTMTNVPKNTVSDALPGQSSMTVRWYLISKVFVLTIPHANTYLRAEERYDHDC
jgi:hypothetical protein